MASGDPLARAASARAVTHAVLASGHHRQATGFALTAAQQLSDAISLTTLDGVSLYGALLLRAAVTAAHGEDRPTALGLLDEAGRRAAGVYPDANAYWTFFNPVNVSLHRVHVAARLGDAGVAIDHARRVDLGKVTLAERRACLYIDVARAYTQWGKHDRAYRALCAAERAAPQEVTSNRSVHQLVQELERRCPATVKNGLRQFARRIGTPA